MHINIHDTFSKELPADPDQTNTRRQVPNACFSFVKPKATKNPSLIHASPEVAELLGITAQDLESDEFLSIFSGNKIIENSKPYAMCYGGHQFGNWAGQLGDGRAINLGEVVHNDQRWAMQLKGAGPTPYSRTADGLAVLRSSIREHLCSEAMFHLGVPTTRSLSLSLTGDEVLRDIMYNGNAAYEKGAVVCRVAPSFIRFGNFQIFAARDDIDSLKKLTNYTIRHFFPKHKEDTKDGTLGFLKEVAERSLDMVLHWQRVGFVHGVMNTDNMSILGLTIDYGPYGWLENYDPDWTPNTTDKATRRYRFGQQPNVVLWNLIQLANALYPLIEETEPIEQIIKDFQKDYKKKYVAMMFSKLGLSTGSNPNIIAELLENLQLIETDMTIFFRQLATCKKSWTEHNISDFYKTMQQAFYKIENLNEEHKTKWQKWFVLYLKAVQKETDTDEVRKEKMNLVNPKYVLRNYMAQLAIDQADNGDYSLIHNFYSMLSKPYEDQPEFEKWYAKRPEWARHKVGCSMLSCSS